MLKTVFIFCCLASLISCGGGGGSAPIAIPPDAAQSPNGSNLSDLNPNFDGYLYLSHRSRKSMLDLKKGTIFSLRTGTSSFHVTPDAKHFVMYYDDFDSDAYDDRKIDWFNEYGLTTRSMQTTSDLFGIAKLSNDGRLLAIGIRDEYSDPFRLVIINENNQSIFERSNAASELPFTTWEWLANGDLIFAEESTLYRLSGLQSNQPSVTSLYSLPYAPYHISVSPDQSKISFNMYTGDGNHHIYVMELATGNYRQLTDSNNNEHGASWSPDGEHIAFNNGEDFVFCYGFGLDCLTDCPLVYIADSKAEKIWVSEDETNQAYRVQIYQENSTDPVCSRDQLEWRNTPIETSSKLGSPPVATDGGTGYPGTLIFEGGLLDLQVDQLNLNTLSNNPIPSRFEDPDKLNTSKDGQLLAMKMSNRDTDYFEKIFIRDRQGNDVEVIDLDDSNGFPKLSPNGAWLAVEYHAIDLGDEPGDSIVSIVQRVPGAEHEAEFVSRFKDFDAWEWTPDNRLILVRGQHLYVSNTELTSAEPYFTLPNRIERLRLSPDGKKLAFIMNAHAWIIDDFRNYNSEPVSIRQLTTSSGQESALAWSYDGRYMAVTYDAITDCHDIYLLPSDGKNIYVGNEKNIATSAIPIGRPRDDGGLNQFCAYYGSLDWVQ